MAAVVACVLLAAQAFAFAHSLDADAHSNGHVCEVCVSVAGFHAGNVGDAAVPLAPVAVRDAFLPPCTARTEPAVAFSLARGPPVSA